LRELATGIGILTQPQKAPWLKARVIGDAMDLGLLGGAAFSKNSNGIQVAAAAAAVAGVTAIDYASCKEVQPRPQPGTGDFATHPQVMEVRRSVIVNRSPADLYRIWHNFQELPRFIWNVVSVEKNADNRWHWVTQGPGGVRVEWDAEITDDRPDQLIAWRSLPNGDVEHAGSVRFERATGGRGTIIKVELKYRPPAGKAGAALAKMFGKSPEKQIASDLLRFKQMVETGEIARTKRQPAGRRRSTSKVYDELVRA